MARLVTAAARCKRGRGVGSRWSAARSPRHVRRGPRRARRRRGRRPARRSTRPRSAEARPAAGRPLEADDAGGGIRRPRTRPPTHGRNGGVRWRAGSAPAPPRRRRSSLEVGEHHRRRRPSAPGPAIEPRSGGRSRLLLEAADEQRPRRLGAALVLDRPAQGEHRPSRDEVHRQAPAGRWRSSAKIDGSIVSVAGPEAGDGRLQRHAGLAVVDDLADLVDLGGGVPAVPTGQAHRSREAVPRLPGPQRLLTARRWPSTGRRSPATR